jgi:hypothetical protein
MKTKCIISPKATKRNIENKNELITIIILCDTPGYRMKSYGPLPLITIENNKLIDLQIQAIQRTFINFEIIVCVGFDAEKTCKYIRNKYHNLNIRIVENQLFNSSNSCESVRISLNNTLNNKVLICDGNLLFNEKILSLFRVDQTCVLVESEPSENLEIGINVNENNEAQYFSFGAYKIWSEMLFLHNKEIVEIFRKIVSSIDNKNKFIFEALNDIIKIKYRIKCIDNKYPLQKISNIKTYHAIKGKK